MAVHPSESPDQLEAISVNTLTAEGIAALDPETQDLVRRRQRAMGPGYRLSFSEPFQPVRALGTKIWDKNGDEYIDAYNNVPAVGHNHPTVVDAVCRQMAILNTNTRYLQADVIEFAEEFVATQTPEITSVMFTCTGSEANDLALRLARQVTGGTGVIVSEFAYHGNTRDVTEWSPSSGLKTARPPEICTVPAPDTFRIPDDERPEWFGAKVREAIATLQSRGIKPAAMVADSLFSSDGIFCDPRVLAPAVEAIHEAGGVFVADEVQSGFARTGETLWGYQRAGIVPDITTMGKSMGNGIPIGAMATQWDHIVNFAENVPYFNTYGGGNVAIAAARAVLQVIREENLLDNAADKGAQLATGIREILTSFGVPADVRSSGLYIGVEYVEDLQSKRPRPAMAQAVADGLKDRHIIISATSPYGDTLKIRPPLVVSQADVDRILAEFEAVTKELVG